MIVGWWWYEKLAAVAGERERERDMGEYACIRGTSSSGGGAYLRGIINQQRIVRMGDSCSLQCVDSTAISR